MIFNDLHRIFIPIFVQNGEIVFAKKTFAEALAYFCLLVYNIYKNGAKWCEVFESGAKTYCETIKTPAQLKKKDRREGAEMLLGGEYRHVVDTKNRLFIPAKLRDELGGTFVITKAFRNRCLTIYSLAEWEKYIEPIRQQERKLVEEALRFLHAPLITVTPDSQGRVVLTPALMRYAQIDKNAVIVGCSSYAEIWAAENYVSVEDEDNEEKRLEMVAQLERFGL